MRPVGGRSTKNPPSKVRYSRMICRQARLRCQDGPMPQSDPLVVERFSALTWEFAPNDPKTVKLFEDRIEGAARRGRSITYSDLVREVEFHLGSGPHTINTEAWTASDRDLVADYMGFIAHRSYCAGGFLSSALVVDKTNSDPGQVFFELANDVGLLNDQSDLSRRTFWSQQMRSAHEFHRR